MRSCTPLQCGARCRAVVLAGLVALAGTLVLPAGAGQAAPFVLRVKEGVNSVGAALPDPADSKRIIGLFSQLSGPDARLFRQPAPGGTLNVFELQTGTFEYDGPGRKRQYRIRATASPPAGEAFDRDIVIRVVNVVEQPDAVPAAVRLKFFDTAPGRPVFVHRVRTKPDADAPTGFRLGIVAYPGGTGPGVLSAETFPFVIDRLGIVTWDASRLPASFARQDRAYGTYGMTVTPLSNGGAGAPQTLTVRVAKIPVTIEPLVYNVREGETGVQLRVAGSGAGATRWEKVGGGLDNALVSLDPSGRLQRSGDTTAFDYEARERYRVRVRATGPTASDTRVVTINVINTVEKPNALKLRQSDATPAVTLADLYAGDQARILGPGQIKTDPEHDRAVGFERRALWKDGKKLASSGSPYWDTGDGFWVGSRGQITARGPLAAGRYTLVLAPFNIKNGQRQFGTPVHVVFRVRPQKPTIQLWGVPIQPCSRKNNTDQPCPIDRSFARVHRAVDGTAESASHAFRLIHNGSAPLEVGQISVEPGNGSANFTVTQPVGKKLSTTSGSATFRVNFTVPSVWPDKKLSLSDRTHRATILIPILGDAGQTVMTFRMFAVYYVRVPKATVMVDGNEMRKGDTAVFTWDPADSSLDNTIRKTFTITNKGKTSLVLKESPEFRATNSKFGYLSPGFAKTTLAPDAQTTVTITFDKRDVTETYADVLKIDYAPGGRTTGRMRLLEIPVEARPLPVQPPLVTLSEAPVVNDAPGLASPVARDGEVDFGPAVIGSNRARRHLVLTNNANGNLRIEKVLRLSGSNWLFALPVPGSSMPDITRLDTTLQRGEKFPFRLHFMPVEPSETAKTAKFRITYTDQTNPDKPLSQVFDFSARGSTIDRRRLPTSTLQVAGPLGYQGFTEPWDSNRPRAFSAVAGRASDLKFTVSNVAGNRVDVNTAGITISGKDAARFAVVPSGLLRLSQAGQPGASDSFTIKFTPPATGSGPFAATVHIPSASPAGVHFARYILPLSVTTFMPKVDVTVRDGPALQDGHADFGSVFVGRTRPVSRTFTVTNKGRRPVTLRGGVVLAAGNGDGFRVADGFGKGDVVLAAAGGSGASRDFTLSFTPPAGGKAGDTPAAIFSIQYVAGAGSRLSVPLTTGATLVAEPVSVLGPAPSTTVRPGGVEVDLGSVVAGSGQQRFVFEVVNRESWPVRIGTMTAQGGGSPDFALTQPASPLLSGSGAGTIFEVAFTPPAGSGRKTVTVQLPVQAADNTPLRTYTFPLVVTVTAAEKGEPVVPPPEPGGGSLAVVVPPLVLDENADVGHVFGVFTARRGESPVKAKSFALSGADTALFAVNDAGSISRLAAGILRPGRYDKLQVTATADPVSGDKPETSAPLAIAVTVRDNVRPAITTTSVTLPVPDEKKPARLETDTYATGFSVRGKAWLSVDATGVLSLAAGKVPDDDWEVTHTVTATARDAVGPGPDKPVRVVLGANPAHGLTVRVAVSPAPRTRFGLTVAATGGDAPGGGAPARVFGAARRLSVVAAAGQPGSVRVARPAGLKGATLPLRVTLDALPPGFRITGIACGASATATNTTPKGADLGRGRFDIGLGRRHVICTVSVSGVDAATVIRLTEAAIDRFLERRVDLLSGDSLNVPARFQGSGGNPGPVGVGFEATDSRNLAVSLETSLAQLRGHARREAARRRPSREVAAGEPGLEVPFGPSRVDTMDDPRHDIWGKVHYGTFAERESGGSPDYKGWWLTVSLGGDVRVTEDVLVGLMGRLDRMEGKLDGPGGDASGTGWMIGPYAAARFGHDRNLFAEVKGLWGQSYNRVDPLGSYRDSFRTNRWQVAGKLSGNFDLGPVRLVPAAGVSWFNESQRAYTDRNGYRIGSRDISIGRLQFGPGISRDFHLGEASLTVTGRIDGLWNFARSKKRHARSVNLDDDFRGQGKLGVDVSLPSGVTVGLSGRHDGIGTRRYEAWGGEIDIHIPLN